MDHLEPDFEWDEGKSAANLEKHGIDFYEARELWAAPTYEIPLSHRGETRIMAVGRIRGEGWTGIYTPRDGRVRIISVRRSTQKEASFYDRHANQ